VKLNASSALFGVMTAFPVSNRLAKDAELTEEDVPGSWVPSTSKLSALTAVVLIVGELVAAWELAVKQAILGLVIGSKLPGSCLRGVTATCKDL